MKNRGFLCVRDVCSVLKISPGSLYFQIKHKQLEAERVGTFWYINVESFGDRVPEDFVSALRAKANGGTSPTKGRSLFSEHSK